MLFPLMPNNWLTDGVLETSGLLNAEICKAISLTNEAKIGVGSVAGVGGRPKSDRSHIPDNASRLRLD